jgi:AraC-like DNA-binding protein
MENSLTIHDVKRVFNGILKVGILKTKPEGRAFDGFVYFTEGEVTYKFDTHELKVSADNIIFLPKGSVYEMHIDKKSKYICVDFCFEKSRYVRRADAYKNLPSSVQNEFSKLFYNQYRSEPWCKAEAFSSLYNIYAQALRSKYKSYSKSSKKTTDAIRYILENYTEPSLSVSSISNYVGISETHLRRLVKSKLNMSPIQYITSLRIEKAKNMLISSNCMISEIASFCGFLDQYYFSREFKAAVGISPTDFKKAHSID